MKDNVRFKFDEKINGYVITMTDFVSLAAIEEWKKRFDIELKSIPFSQKIVMLIDTGKHEFESIQCLKSLREFFTTNSVIQSNGVKAAFVQPKNYIEPHVKSEFEAYFEKSDDAYKWLEE